MTEDYFPVQPTANTVTMFNLLRQQFGKNSFEDEYNQNRAKYTSTNKWLQTFLGDKFHQNIQVVAEADEFLDGIGNQAAEHTLRLVKVVDQKAHIYYFLLTGVAVLETKKDELINAGQLARQNDPFMVQNQELKLNEPALARCILALAKNYFKDAVTMDDVAQMYAFQNIGGKFLDPGLTQVDPDSGQINRLCYLLTTQKKWQNNA
ncbi:hypothetical protein [Lactobacillus selangorensis]|nr:hypothetical protein [Lactobacillus selangorensis]